VPGFPVIAYVAAFLAALAGAAITLPPWRSFCARHGWVDDPGERKIHAVRTPLAGGWAVFSGLAMALLLGAAAIAMGWGGADAVRLMSHGMGRRAIQLVAVLAGAAAMLGIGAWDDRNELRPGTKLACQVTVALAVALAGVRITLFVPSMGFSLAVTVLWILAVTNALNLSDNMNGLCTGLAAIASMAFSLVAARHGQYLVGTFGFAVSGAFLGFLPFNFPRASAFLGDAGSHLAGYLLATLAILPHFYSERHGALRPAAVLLPLLVLGIPLLDVAQVVAWRTLHRRPFWIGDTNHLSHRLARTRLGRVGAVVVLWSAAALLGAIAVLA
jgi:UDP-GlcNAc:undecaprenyl-phosphate GlcNAc-1-phosphate transferase